MSNLFKLIKKIGGRSIVDSIDTLPVINRRKKQLIASYRGQKVDISIEPAEEDENKFRKPLADASWKSGCVDYKVKAKIKATKKRNR